MVKQSVLTTDERPAVMVAKCLAGYACRYHGRLTPARVKLLERLQKRYRIVLVCPEEESGLPTPRPPARWQGDRLIADGRDVTEFFDRGARIALQRAKETGARKFYGLRWSPSCDPVTGMTCRLLKRHKIKTHFG